MAGPPCLRRRLLTSHRPAPAVSRRITKLRCSAVSSAPRRTPPTYATSLRRRRPSAARSALHRLTLTSTARTTRCVVKRMVGALCQVASLPLAMIVLALITRIRSPPLHSHASHPPLIVRPMPAPPHTHAAQTYLKLGSDWPIFGFFIGLCAVQLGMTFAGHSHMRLGDNQFA